jgi:hypothetical protein
LPARATPRRKQQTGPLFKPRRIAWPLPFFLLKAVPAVLALIELAGPFPRIFGGFLAVRADAHDALRGVVDEMRPDWIHGFSVGFSPAITESLLFIVPARWPSIKKR